MTFAELDCNVPQPRPRAATGGLDRHRRSGRSDKGRKIIIARRVPQRRVIGVLQLAVKIQAKAQLPDPPESMHVTVDDGGQRPIAVALRGVFRGKDVGTEGDQLEAGSREEGTVMPRAPAAILLEHVSAGGAWFSAGEEVVIACSPVMGRLRGNYIGRANPVYGYFCCGAIFGSFTKMPMCETPQF